MLEIKELKTELSKVGERDCVFSLFSSLVCFCGLSVRLSLSKLPMQSSSAFVTSWKISEEKKALEQIQELQAASATDHNRVIQLMFQKEEMRKEAREKSEALDEAKSTITKLVLLLLFCV